MNAPLAFLALALPMLLAGCSCLSGVRCRDADGDSWGGDDCQSTCGAFDSGYDAGMGDCDDDDASIYPGADEVCGDGIDQDCDGEDAPCP
jgi:hypothetical protein